MTGALIGIGICWFIGVIVWDLITDGRKYNHAEIVQHTKEWWVRVSLMMPAIILMIPANQIMFTWHTLWMFISCGMMVGSWFWVLFDGLYNTRIIGRRDFWALIGTTSRLDQFLQDIGRTPAQVIKISLVGIWTVVYIVSLLKYEIL